MRDNIVAGNWKMNNDYSQTKKLINDLKSFKIPDDVRIMVAPSFTQLSQCKNLLSSTNISVVAQNMNANNSGAFTGEISASMLKGIEVNTVIIGHSERRSIFNETDEILKEKVKSAFIHAYGFCPKIKLVHHALAHVAGTYFSSGFKDSLILSVDGMGDKLATMVAEGKNGKINEIYRGDNTKGQLESLGAFYAMFTEFLGFKKTEGEYKLMGMAAYGKKIYNLDHIIKVQNTPFKINLNKNLFVPWNVSSNFQPEVNYNYLNKFFLPKKSGEENFKQHHFDLAKSVQLKYEEILMKIIKKFKKDHTNLSFAGGCGLNCLANSKLDKIFENLYVMPASSDRGLSIGCAYLGFYNLKKKVYKIQDMFLGLKYSKNQIEGILKTSKIKLEDDVSTASA